MDIRFAIGLIGSIILVAGSAYPDHRVSHPVRSAKNWLFAVGNAGMFTYALLGYLSGGSIFFLFLQILIALSTILMMLNTPDRIDTPVIAVAGLALIIWSLMLFEDMRTILFIFGLVIVGLGFALDMGTLRRNGALAVGSALIALFSYLMADWVFFWLNMFFAIFSSYYAFLLLRKA